MTFAAVHQFHSGAAAGDAITNQMFSLQRTLRRAGYVSNVYAEYIAGELAGQVIPIGRFSDAPSTVLLVHHSMGHTAFDLITTLQVPKITIFHSITPAAFFDDAWFRERIHVGFAQLRELARISVAGVADSNHNRLQMLDAGFDSVAVLPVRTDYSEFRSIPRSATPATRDWLFVGRLAPNKCQRELVTAFAAYRRAYPEGHLHLVGDDSLDMYVTSIREEIHCHGLSHHVSIHGKVTDDELRHRYQQAGALVCLSKHEGFGVPLLEAMAAGVPVIARDQAAVGETMGGAGLLLRDADPETVAAAFRVLIEDTDLRARLIDDQDHRLASIENFDTLATLNHVLAVAEGRDSARWPSVQIQGPFETSYSLAILNRELALELSTRDYDVSIHATEGPGDYVPDPAHLRNHPKAAHLFGKAQGCQFPDVAIRQMFPPRVDDSVAGITFQYFGWEESRLPAEYVANFNRHLDGIGVMSSYVGDVLVNEGVTVPVTVVGVGVHTPDPDPPVHDLGVERSDRFTFLHISSAFPRKGVDVLLLAYFESFTADDPVRLIVKTFPNPHNDVANILEDLTQRFPHHPDVVWLDTDFDRGGLDALYSLADVYVHPARGEGFGLPVAEAMLAGVPVISTAAGGLADFVNADTAAVVGHELHPARTHLTLPGSMWFEPDRDDLRTEMLAAASRRNEDLAKARAATARKLISEMYSWPTVADRWVEFIDTTRRQRAGRTIAVVSTFNSRCGIAEYCGNLYSAIGEWAGIEVMADRNATLIDPLDDVGINRIWDNYRSAPVDDLLLALTASNADITHIQYNFGFYKLPQLARIIRQESARRPTILTLHRTAPLHVDGVIEQLADIVDELNLCDAVIVHQESDLEYLASLDVVANVRLLPIGSPTAWMPTSPSEMALRKTGSHAFTVGTYGFLLPHKGLLYLLEAAAILRARGIDVGVIACCAIHPDPRSSEHHKAVLEEIRRLGLETAVELHTEYLPNEESLALLADSDVIALPYDPTEESSSAALRSILPLARPIVTSNIDIFRDVKRLVRQIPSPVSPTALADELECLWLDDGSRDRLVHAVREHIRSTSWAVVGRKTRELYSSVILSRDLQRPELVASSATMSTS